MKTRRELATLWQLESMIRMRNSLLNWEKGWLNSPMNKRVRFQSHLNRRFLNRSSLLEMVNIKMFKLEFTRTNLEKSTAAYQSAKKLMAFTRGKELM